jgi:predicted negative regulator of RcsB-dependent stress response
MNNHNRAYSEIYILRGNVYKRQGNKDAAKKEYEKAVFYNKNLTAATTVLTSL